MSTKSAGFMYRFPSDWIDYAHGPGAESGQPLARELCDLATGTYFYLDETKAHLVREIISVAELYCPAERGADREERNRAKRAAWIIQRGRDYLEKLASVTRG